ncbi:hypothetical protein GYMLUDRAFT_251720 [Collybiopsis luxurians FD-317 M1]|uniref:Uncharacterized protein n=1 Tax=Collybiopsis luxurians FD-317 M1 TaxID=944289 RepID=A0A0D0ANG7_9AGAR|nr:hypothetical protein GYMLUDRAFT_251720 [Collybiopsis luxurians FD-317 M1]
MTTVFLEAFVSLLFADSERWDEIIIHDGLNQLTFANFDVNFDPALAQFDFNDPAFAGINFNNLNFDFTSNADGNTGTKDLNEPAGQPSSPLHNTPPLSISMGSFSDGQDEREPMLPSKTPGTTSSAPPVSSHSNPSISSSSTCSVSLHPSVISELQVALANGNAATCATTHAQCNPLLPTQCFCECIKAVPKCDIPAAQQKTMQEARLVASAQAKCLQDDILLLVSKQKDMMTELAQKHSLTVEHIKGLLSINSNYKPQKLLGRIQVLTYLKAQEVNTSLPPGQKLKAHELHKLVNKDPNLLALSEDKV